MFENKEQVMAVLTDWMNTCIKSGLFADVQGVNTIQGVVAFVGTRMQVIPDNKVDTTLLQKNTAIKKIANKKAAKKR